MTELHALLAEYEARKLAEAATEQADEAERQRASELLRAVALPVLSELAATLKASRHSCTVKERLGSYFEPNLELVFRPVGAASESTLALICKGGGRVTVRQEIRAPAGVSRTASFDSNATWPLDAMNAAQVSDCALEFVAAVLRAN